VRAAFAKLDVVALAVAAGCISALVLWAATAWLLLRGAPPGMHVGPHLVLLSHFLPGYSVSWSGSVLGLFYGFVIGAIGGAIVAIAWNLSHFVYLMSVARRGNLLGDL